MKSGCRNERRSAGITNIAKWLCAVGFCTFILAGNAAGADPRRIAPDSFEGLKIGTGMNPNVIIRGTKLSSCPQMVGDKFPVGQTCVHKESKFRAPEVYVLRGNMPLLFGIAITELCLVWADGNFHGGVYVIRDATPAKFAAIRSGLYGRYGPPTKPIGELGVSQWNWSKEQIQVILANDSGLLNEPLLSDETPSNTIAIAVGHLDSSDEP
jgi:hypothetical protein